MKIYSRQKRRKSFPRSKSVRYQKERLILPKWTNQLILFKKYFRFSLRVLKNNLFNPKVETFITYSTIE